MSAQCSIHGISVGTKARCVHPLHPQPYHALRNPLLRPMDPYCSCTSNRYLATHLMVPRANILRLCWYTWKMVGTTAWCIRRDWFLATCMRFMMIWKINLSEKCEDIDFSEFFFWCLIYNCLKFFKSSNFFIIHQWILQWIRIFYSCYYIRCNVLVFYFF